MIGDFNGWNSGADRLSPVRSSGIWSGDVDGARPGHGYKFHIRSRHGGYRVDKADPFAFHSELPPRTGSVVGPRLRLGRRGRLAAVPRERPHLADVHLRGPRGLVASRARRGWLSYRELASTRRPRDRRRLHHVELLPVMEHPFSGSWGYQTTGYFAPTSRFGTPQDLMFLVDHLHRRGLGVILDWVPSHFPSDEHGLAFFDGTPLRTRRSAPRLSPRLAHADPTTAATRCGASCSRARITGSGRTTPTGSAWTRSPRCSISTIPEAGEWLPNVHGGRENLEAVSFLRRLNEDVYREHPGRRRSRRNRRRGRWCRVPRTSAASDSRFKWDMGWMHDTLQHIRREPIHRRYHHGELTFRQVYAYSENFVLPLSPTRSSTARARSSARCPRTTGNGSPTCGCCSAAFGRSPGRLLFMGGELGQRAEWDHDASVSWHLRDEPARGHRPFGARDLNALHRSEPCMRSTWILSASSGSTPPTPKNALLPPARSGCTRHRGRGDQFRRCCTSDSGSACHRVGSGTRR